MDSREGEPQSQVTLRCSRLLQSQLKAKAKSRGISASQLLREIVVDALDKADKSGTDSAMTDNGQDGDG
jgi:hypothetical protein